MTGSLTTEPHVFMVCCTCYMYEQLHDCIATHVPHCPCCCLHICYQVHLIISQDWHVCSKKCHVHVHVHVQSTFPVCRIHVDVHNKYFLGMEMMPLRIHIDVHVVHTYMYNEDSVYSEYIQHTVECCLFSFFLVFCLCWKIATDAPFSDLAQQNLCLRRKGCCVQFVLQSYKLKQHCVGVH